MTKQTRGNIMLLITAIIWGSTFVAQSVGMDYIQPFTYNMVRNYIAFLVLIPVVLFFRKMQIGVRPMSLRDKASLNKTSIIGGIFCGLILAIASSLQQMGISMTTAGKSGFITALYIILVPILSIFLKKKAPKIIWLCVLISLSGFYLLCIKEGLSIGTGDFLCFLCAIGFSLHILIIDHFAGKNTDGILMSCVQFLVAGVISTLLAFWFEAPTMDGIWAARVSILYAAVLSSCIGYTMQILAQRDTNPTIAPLIMSLESVFSVIAGGLFLGEVLSTRELIGCVLVFAAVILSQVPLPARKTTEPLKKKAA